MKSRHTLNVESLRSMPKFWAALTGFLLLLMALSAGIAYGYSFSSLYDVNDNTQTLNHLLADPTKLTIGIAFWIIILVLDLLVSLGVYKLLKSPLKTVAIWATGTRVLYSFFLAMGIAKTLDLWVQLRFSSADVSAEYAQASFAAFNHFWSLGLIIFGIHLLLIGYGFIKISVIPKLLSYLIIFAGFSYVLVHSVGQFGTQGLSLRLILEPILALPMALAELLLALWLIYVGQSKKYKA